MGECAFSNDNHLLALREKRPNGQKNWDGVKDAKIKKPSTDIDSTNCCLILRAKNTGAWMNVRGTTVTSTVFSSKEFRDFLCAHYNVTPPPTSRATVTDAAYPLLYATHLSAEKESWSSHITTKCVMDSSTSLDKP